MNKRAVSPELLVVLLAFIIVAMILITFGTTLSGRLKENADIETCRLSVLAQANSKIAGRSIVPLECPRRHIKFFENKVEVNGKKSKSYEYKRISKDDVNRIVAEELRLCWYKMAEGIADVLEQSVFFTEGKYNICLTCAEIEFDDKLKGQSYDGINNYIRSNKILKQDITYYDYFIRSQQNLYILGIVPWSQNLFSPWTEGTTGKIYEERFVAGDNYIIYFLAFKPAWLVEKTKAYTSAYYLGLGKQDKIARECAILLE